MVDGGQPLAHLGVVGTALDRQSTLAHLGEDDRWVEDLVDDERPLQPAQRRGRDDDGVELRERLAAIEHDPSRQALEAERAYLREIGEGCQLPVGALARVDADGRMTLTGMIATLDGHTLLRHSDVGDDAVTLGRSVARHLLDEGGATALLSEVEA